MRTLNKMTKARVNFILSVCALCVFISFQKLSHQNYLQTVEEIISVPVVEKEHNETANKIKQDLKISSQKNIKKNLTAFTQVEAVTKKEMQKEVQKEVQNKLVGSPKAVIAKLQDACEMNAFPQGVQHNKDVQKYLRQFKQQKSEKNLNTAEVKANLNYIVTQVEKRDLPGSLALIPMVESNFKIHAKSHRGAVGLWQFMPGTGRALGLKCHAGYDGRKDVKASTHAALNYLEYLHKRFNKDWMLALAAYNAGEGTVERAMRRNRRAGKGTSFWALQLPVETKQYVPKIIGLTHYIKQLN
jgi:membrane-bound lytic murein transglycosylase D